MPAASVTGNFPLMALKSLWFLATAVHGSLAAMIQCPPPLPSLYDITFLFHFRSACPRLYTQALLRNTTIPQRFPCFTSPWILFS